MTAQRDHDVSPFTIAVPQEDLDDLDKRLRRTRFPQDFANDDWRYGYNTAYHRQLVEYWIEEYDWRDVERRMNELPHFKVDLMGVPLHFIHVKGKGPDPMPLLLHHGWPWTFWDVRKVIGPLTDPAAHGGDPNQSFEMIESSIARLNELLESAAALEGFGQETFKEGELRPQGHASCESTHTPLPLFDDLVCEGPAAARLQAMNELSVQAAARLSGRLRQLLPKLLRHPEEESVSVPRQAGRTIARFRP